jgi:branched-chain amino acid transport system ATP-binding protein
LTLTPTLLEIDDVHVGYVEGIDILAGVSLRLARGAITGIIGPNGAGKSTLLRAVFGFLHPHRGRILLDGREIHALAPHAIKRLGIAYVTQGPNIFPQLTVEENLLLGAWVLRRDRARVTARLEGAYDAFPHLRERRRRRATTLSGGEAKMLSLAKELMTEPTILLVDEPSAGLAPRIADQIYARLAEARARGLTILLVDQNIAAAVELSDYLYMIERGQVGREGPRDTFAPQLRDIIRDALLGA